MTKLARLSSRDRLTTLSSIPRDRRNAEPRPPPGSLSDAPRNTRKRSLGPLVGAGDFSPSLYDQRFVSLISVISGLAGLFRSTRRTRPGTRTSQTVAVGPPLAW